MELFPGVEVASFECQEVLYSSNTGYSPDNSMLILHLVIIENYCTISLLPRILFNCASVILARRLPGLVSLSSFSFQSQASLASGGACGP